MSFLSFCIFSLWLLCLSFLPVCHICLSVIFACLLYLPVCHFCLSVISACLSFLFVCLLCLSVVQKWKRFFVLLLWIELDLKECPILLNYFTGRLQLHSLVNKTSYLTLINHMFNPNFVINLGLISNKIQARNIFNNKSRSVIRKISNIEYNI